MIVSKLVNSGDDSRFKIAFFLRALLHTTSQHNPTLPTNQPPQSGQTHNRLPPAGSTRTVGSPTFATEFFSSRVMAVKVKESLTSLSTSITNEQTKLRLFSQCLLQRLPHLLSSDILCNLPINNPDPKWEDWNGPLTSNIENIISTFLPSLLNQQYQHPLQSS